MTDMTDMMNTMTMTDMMSMMNMTHMMPMMSLPLEAWFPILAAATIAFLVGGIWYGPLFGKAWKAEQPHRKSGDFKNSVSGMIVQALYLIVLGFAFFTLALLITAWGAFVTLAALTGLGMLSGGIFLGQSRNLSLINIGHQILVLVVFFVVFAVAATM